MGTSLRESRNSCDVLVNGIISVRVLQAAVTPYLRRDHTEIAPTRQSHRLDATRFSQPKPPSISQLSFGRPDHYSVFSCASVR